MNIRPLMRVAGALALAALATIAPTASAGTFRKAGNKGVPDVYMVVLKDGVARKSTQGANGRPTVAELASVLGRAHSANVQEVWQDGLQGFVLRLPEAQARKLAEDPRVKSVEQDFEISAPVTHCYDAGGTYGEWFNDTRPLPASTPSTQYLDCVDPDPENDTTLPGNPPDCRDNWGIDRIDQTSGRNQQFSFNNSGTGVHVYVLDTGIRWSHREFLNAAGTSTRVSGGVDAAHIDGSGNPIPGTAANTNDCYGHGTHVASIIAGRTFGIAKNASIHPIYLFGCGTTNGTFATRVVRGLNWMIADVTNNNRRPAVVNWSGGNATDVTNSDAVRDVVQNVINNNIVFVQAAGNQSGAYQSSNPTGPVDACSLSLGQRVPDLIVAGGMDYLDGRWVRRETEPDFTWCHGSAQDCGSNVGSCIDIWAPSMHVLASNYTGDSLTCQLSGTSMAAPHVSGAAAVYLQSNPTATPQEVATALRSRGIWGYLNANPGSATYIGRDSDNVIVNSDTRSIGDRAPVASFTPSCPGRQCLFDGTGSTDDGGSVSYLWRMPDGTTQTFSSFRQSFPANSTNNVVLRVTDNTGKTDHLLRTFTVNADAAPAASFTVSCTALTCTFNSSASTDDSGIITARNWWFGDGGTASGTTVSHTYASGGMYNVTLQVTDNVGQIGQQIQAAVATANAPPVANFTFSCALNVCSFNGSSSTDDTGIASYAWSFGDATNGSGVTTSRTYASTGLTQYTVTLTVTDLNGQQSSKQRKIHVNGDALSAAHNYFALNPCRLYDSRDTTILTNGTLRVITAAGLCGIPSTAKAVSLNVTAVSPTADGKIALYPGNQTASWAGAKSILNFYPTSSPRANDGIIQLATNGAGTIAINPIVSGSPGQVHVVIDVDGYFSTDTTPASTALGPLGFQTLPICRFYDSRNSTALATGVARSFTAAGTCGIPSGSAALSLHIGVPAPGSTGEARMYPSNVTTPNTSSINFTGGIDHLRNGARVRLAPTAPEITALYTGPTATSQHLYFDVNGYFKSDAPLKYYPITPCRPFDTNDALMGGPALSTGVVRTLQVQSNCGIPSGAKAVFVRLVLSGPTSAGDLTVYPSNLLPSQVAASTVKFSAGEPGGLSMGTIVPLSTLTEDLAVLPGQMTTGGTVGLAIDVFGYFQ